MLLIYAVVDFAVLSNKRNYLSYNVSDKQQINFEDYTSSSAYYIYKAGFDQLYPQGNSIIIKGSDYKTIVGDHQILGVYQGINDTLLTEESGSVTYEFDVSEAGFYQIGLKYYPYAGKSSNIERALYVNDEIPFTGLENLVFSPLLGSERVNQTRHIWQ